VKITILAYLEKETDRTFDVVVGQVAKALKEGGHKASEFGVHGDVRKLIPALRAKKRSRNAADLAGQETPPAKRNVVRSLFESAYAAVAESRFFSPSGAPEHLFRQGFYVK